jgi:hypothetical protein
MAYSPYSNKIIHEENSIVHSNSINNRLSMQPQKNKKKKKIMKKYYLFLLVMIN